MSKLIELDSNTAMLEWEKAEGYLAKSIQSDMLENQLLLVKGRIFAGMNTLWRVENDAGFPIAWAVTMLYTADGISSVAQIQVGTAEDLELFLSKMAEFEKWAHDKGASFIEIVGRNGWLRKLRPMGFNHNYTSLLKRISMEIH